MSKRMSRDGINFVISIQLRSEHVSIRWCNNSMYRYYLLLPMQVREPLPNAKKLRSTRRVSLAFEEYLEIIPI
jgi:hypothetical protein